jgi:hypothetical protein
MKCASAKTTSLALGSTIAILYSLCALVMAVFPNAVFGWVKSVAHGVNLNALEIGATSFTFGEYLAGLLCVTAYAMIAGYIYGGARNFFGGRESEGAEVGRRPASPARA